MVFYCCENCGKQFKRKEYYIKHIDKDNKRSCYSMVGNSLCNLGQYFTTHNKLK